MCIDSPVRRFFALVAIGAALAASGGRAFAQASPSPTATATATPSPAATPSSEDSAKGFLARLEAKNADTKSLRAKFTQLRVDESFLDEVKSSGSFEYMAPAKFRADYVGEKGKVAGSTVYLLDDKMYSYVPEQGQVDIIQLPKGDSAAVHQMLLGFGVKVDRILEFFRVRRVTEGAEPGKFIIAFESKNRQRTLNYAKITITFGEGTLLPEILRMEDSESVTTITLTGIELNAEVDPAVFVPKFPDGVDQIEHAAGEMSISEDDF